MAVPESQKQPASNAGGPAMLRFAQMALSLQVQFLRTRCLRRFWWRKSVLPNAHSSRLQPQHQDHHHHRRHRQRLRGTSRTSWFHRLWSQKRNRCRWQVARKTARALTLLKLSRPETALTASTRERKFAFVAGLLALLLFGTSRASVASSTTRL